KTTPDFLVTSRYSGRAAIRKPRTGRPGDAPLRRSLTLDKEGQRATKKQPSHSLQSAFFKTCCINNTTRRTAPHVAESSVNRLKSLSIFRHAQRCHTAITSAPCCVFGGATST